MMPHSALAQDAALPGSDTLNKVATSLSTAGTSGLTAQAASAATSYASSSAQDWLSQFGTARVQLNVDDSGNWDNSAFDFLAPVYDNQKAMLFTQLGLRAPDGRVTGNVGMGVRTFYTKDWMFGGNVFFDDDFTGKNRRVGAGLEAWTNNVKFSANTYLGTTDWHQSRDFDDYDEKPADGYDLRAEGYLPTWPQLGAKLMYEQYYGENVALFDKDTQQKNPSAVTVGLNYTPVPLITAGVDYKRGQDSMDEVTVGVNFRYVLGESWQQQISPAQVALERSLAGSRTDLVERNNEIVLQYQKQDKQSVSKLNLQVTVDSSPADGISANQARVIATTQSGEPVRNTTISWSVSGSAKLTSSSTVTDSSGVASVSFTDTQKESVQISARSGAVSVSSSSQFATQETSGKVALKVTKDNSASDGLDADHAIATVTDSNNTPLANRTISWSLSGGGKLKNAQTTTDKNGQAGADFTSSKAGTVLVTAVVDGNKGAVQGHFITAGSTEVISHFNVTSGALANGTAHNVATVTVVDTRGNPVANADVSWTTDKSTAVLTPGGKTDANGQATLTISDTSAEAVKITATVDNNSQTKLTVFKADATTATIKNLVVNSGTVADNVTTTVAAVVVVDANGKPMRNADVTWSVDGSAKLSTSSSKTDISGKAAITLTSTKAETVNVTAKVNDSVQTKPTTFIADATTAKPMSYAMERDDANADELPGDTANVLVQDDNGNPVPGVTVYWLQDHTSVDDWAVNPVPTNSTSVTDSSGHAYMRILGKAETDATPGQHPAKLDARVTTSKYDTVLEIDMTFVVAA
ncbi:inverse autotransporter beta domain-containing protein [Citrobacter sp. ANG330]|uniref:inverse autotransporter beta domain-containing protein n=1 Tax=Citrobacter sp. ANG330 TaxID=3048142 RepID=UPI0039C08A63